MRGPKPSSRPGASGAPRCGIVLAGGASSRMGRDKAWIEIDGETLAARTARVVADVCDVVIVVGAPGRPLPPLPSTVVVTFDGVRFGGPLDGVVAGLSAAPPRVAAHALLVGVDVPRLRAEPLAALLALAPAGRAVAVEGRGGLEPLPSWVPVAALRARLGVSHADRSLRGLLHGLEVRAVTTDELLAHSARFAAEDPELTSLRDADDEAALAELTTSPAAAAPSSRGRGASRA